MPGALYVVATPIGNVEDLSPRARRTLEQADVVAAEDTRLSGLLLNRLGIRAKLVSCHKFNERSRLDSLIKVMEDGGRVALISDAGTPCICDPGSLLVQAAAQAGVEVVGISGPCAAVTALSVSGFTCSEFRFCGFLPREAKDLRALFASFAEGEISVLAGYESPNRILASMSALAQELPDCRVCLCNDLTKRFERIYRGTPDRVLEALAANPNAQKGEYTLVLFRENRRERQQRESALSCEAALIQLIVSRGVSMKEAIAAAAEEYGFPKKAAYAASLRLKQLFSDTDG